jgi:Sec-independent protein translocase protein TatA
VFDLSLPKLLVLAVIALVIFGPNELPTIASQAACCGPVRATARTPS